MGRLISRREFAIMACAVGVAAKAKAAIPPLRIGIIADMNGVYATNGGPGAVLAVRMAVEDFGGHVLDRPVDVLSADYQTKVDIASGIATKWFDADDVSMIIEHSDSASAMAIQKIGEERKRITIAAGSGTTDLTSKACSPYGIHYVYDTYALAAGAARAIVGEGGKTWFIIEADYAFGHSLANNTTKMVEALGGKVLGSAKHPLGSSDFASYLLQAQSSKAQVVAFANSGADFSNAVKQAAEFGLTKGGQRLAGLLVFNTDVKAIGLGIAQGMEFVTAYDWNYDDTTRAFGHKFFKRFQAMPTMTQAGIYSAVTHYLRAVQEAGDPAASKVMSRLRKTQFDDFFSRHGHLRPDGLMVHDMFLARAKKPSESKGPWDLITVETVIPGDKAFAPISESQCPLVHS